MAVAGFDKLSLVEAGTELGLQSAWQRTLPISGAFLLLRREILVGARRHSLRSPGIGLCPGCPAGAKIDCDLVLDLVTFGREAVEIGLAQVA